MHGFIRQLPEVRQQQRRAANEEQRLVLTLVENKMKAAHAHAQRLEGEERTPHGQGRADESRDAGQSRGERRESRPLSRRPATGYGGPHTSAEALAIHQALGEIREEIRRGYRS